MNEMCKILPYSMQYAFRNYRDCERVERLYVRHAVRRINKHRPNDDK